MPQYKYKQARVNLSSFSFFEQIPTAEKWGLAGLASSLAIKFLTQSSTGCIVVFFFWTKKYNYKKKKKKQTFKK